MLYRNELEVLAPRAVRLNKVPKLLNAAFKLAETSDYEAYKLGAIIANKPSGTILSMGVNRNKMSPLQDKYSPVYGRGENSIKSKSLHAEVDAISRVRYKDLSGSCIFVARITKQGNWANSRPCCGCQKAIKDFGIAKMFYYIDGAFYVEDVQ